MHVYSGEDTIHSDGEWDQYKYKWRDSYKNVYSLQYKERWNHGEVPIKPLNRDGINYLI